MDCYLTKSKKIFKNSSVTGDETKIYIKIVSEKKQLKLWPVKRIHKRLNDSWMMTSNKEERLKSNFIKF